MYKINGKEVSYGAISHSKGRKKIAKEASYDNSNGIAPLFELRLRPLRTLSHRRKLSHKRYSSIAFRNGILTIEHTVSERLSVHPVTCVEAKWFTEALGYKDRET